MLKALLNFGSTYQPTKVQFIMELYYQTGCVCSLPFVGSFILHVMWWNYFFVYRWLGHNIVFSTIVSQF
jgi:hypothetical protein